MEVRLVALNGGGFVLYGPGERAQGFSDLDELVSELKIMVADEMVRVHAASPVGGVRPPPEAPTDWFPRDRSSGRVLLSDPPKFADTPLDTSHVGRPWAGPATGSVDDGQPIKWSHRGVVIEPGDLVTWSGLKGMFTGTFKQLSDNLEFAVMENGMLARMHQILDVLKPEKAPGAR